jgi:hypothetical protein
VTQRCKKNPRRNTCAHTNNALGGAKTCLNDNDCWTQNYRFMCAYECVHVYAGAAISVGVQVDVCFKWFTHVDVGVHVNGFACGRLATTGVVV